MYDALMDSYNDKKFNADLTKDKTGVFEWEGARILHDEGFDLKTINFAFYLAIHTSISDEKGRHQFRNNPPIPPYMNVGVVKFYKQIYDEEPTQENKDRLETELNELINFMVNFDFYKKDQFMVKLLNSGNIG